MEDSEKRKEMLKAMRMEAAAQNNDSTGPETSMNPSHLSNPLADTSTQQQESCETPRFDYYTDPMSAYSSFKKNKTPKQQYSSSPSHQISSPLPHFPPSVPDCCVEMNQRTSSYKSLETHNSKAVAKFRRCKVMIQAADDSRENETKRSRRRTRKTIQI